MDLTKFDFHAMRFMHSEVVKAMSAEEVGQFVLLLCEAWLLQKGASLPDDSAYLNNTARGKVSTKVLAQFPIMKTEFGERRRNDVLYEEWLTTLERSQSGRKSAEVRWQSERNATAMRTHSDGMPSAIPIPYQSNQTNQSNDADFKNLMRRFRSHFHFKAGKRDKDVQDYIKSCKKYRGGEDWILDQFDKWAEENMWVAEKKAKFPLSKFYEDLDEIEEAEALEATWKKPEDDPAIIHANLELIAQKGREQADKIFAEFEKEQEDIEQLKEQPFAC